MTKANQEITNLTPVKRKDKQNYQLTTGILLKLEIITLLKNTILLLILMMTHIRVRSREIKRGPP